MNANPGPNVTLTTVSAYNTGAHEYAEHSNDRTPLNRLHDRFRDLLSPEARILDLGCGPGHDAAELATRGLRVTAFDPAGGLLAEAKAHASITHLVQGDARLLPFAPQSFDGIWACASLLHVPKGEVPAALSEASRCLRSGGVLFTSMQHGQGELIVDRSLELPVRYYFFYLSDEWSRLVSNAGFELIDQQVNPTTAGLTKGATGWIETFARKP
jgi:SAM-dependent methyltransferase